MDLGRTLRVSCAYLLRWSIRWSWSARDARLCDGDACAQNTHETAGYSLQSEGQELPSLSVAHYISCSRAMQMSASSNILTTHSTFSSSVSEGRLYRNLTCAQRHDKGYIEGATTRHGVPRDRVVTEMAAS